MSRPGLTDVRGAWWTVRAVHAARRGLARDGLPGLVVPPPPHLRGGDRGVAAVLRRTEATCLVRSAVRQAWLSARGRPVDLIIGVTAPGSSLGAHAWLEGDRPFAGDGFHELIRFPPR